MRKAADDFRFQKKRSTSPEPLKNSEINEESSLTLDGISLKEPQSTQKFWRRWFVRNKHTALKPKNKPEKTSFGQKIKKIFSSRKSRLEEEAAAAMEVAADSSSELAVPTI